MIVINGEYEGGSSINFYTRKMVYIHNGRSANLEYGSYFEDAPEIFLDDEALVETVGRFEPCFSVYRFTGNRDPDTFAPPTGFQIR